MRILFISAFYPPSVIGGWEQLVEEINSRLSARGHTTRVLTSNHGTGMSSPTEPGIDRVLRLESNLANYHPINSFVKRRGRLHSNLACTLQAVSAFDPDIVFVHCLWNLSRSIAWYAEQLRPGRVVYYVASDWPYAPDVHTAYWKQLGVRVGRRLMKRAMAAPALWLLAREARAFPLRFEHVLCVSHAVKSDLARYSGIPLERMRVIYNGIDVERFSLSGRVDERVVCNSLSLLYAGGLAAHKGVTTAIEGMALLARNGSLDGMTLTIVGSGHPQYEACLRSLAESEGLSDHVRFQSWIPREEMPDLLRKHDVFIFPSHQDALPRAVQEAMSSGLVVVGTPAGGTKELLIEGETGLTFEPGDARALASQLDRLKRNRDLRVRLRDTARARVLRDFDIRRTVDEIEYYLSDVMSRTANAPVQSAATVV